MIILAAGIALVIIAAAAILLRSRSKKPAETRQNFAYQPEIRPVFPLAKRTGPAPVVTAPDPVPHLKTVSVIDGQTTINGSLRALALKYSLDQFTLATSDGLLFASSEGISAYEDAARYAALYTGNPTDGTEGIALFGFTHRGSDLVGIARTTLQISRERRRMIVDETQVILNWWI